MHTCTAGSPATEPITADTTGTRSQQLGLDGGERVAVGQVGAPEVLEAAHAAAGRVEQADVGEHPLLGPLAGAQLDAEPALGAAARAAAHREVTAGHDDLAAVDRAHPVDVPLGREVGECLTVVASLADEHPELAEGAFVGEQRDPFAHRQLAAGPLAGDSFRAAHAPGEVLAQLELL